MQKITDSKPAQGKIVNYSFDDTYGILQELTAHENDYDSIFDCQKLALLKNLNKKYDAKFSIFCFEEANDYQINLATTKFQKEFKKNSNWLKFGYHGKNKATKFDESFSMENFVESYNHVEQAIINFAGKKSLCHTIRLHFFMCTAQEKLFLKKKGIVGLFAADDSRVSYDLSQKENLQLQTERFFQKDMFYYATDLRLEKVSDLQTSLNALQNLEHVSIFTHEYEFDRQIGKLESVIQWFYNQGYECSFFE